MFLPFGKWRTEHPRFGFGHLTVAKNVRPLAAGGYAPVYNPSALASAHTGATNEFYRSNSYYVHRSIENSNAGGIGAGYGWKYWRYYGTNQALFEWPLVGGSTTNVRARDYAAEAAALGTPLEPEPWNFHSWGKVVLATNYANPVQRLASAGSGSFADCITSTGTTATNPAKPKARYISSLGQHVVLANINLPSNFPSNVSPALAAGEHPQLVWWSRTDDERSYSDETRDPTWNSSFQPLVDLPGPITGLAKVGDDALVIFKPGGSHLMSRTGDSSLYSFQVLHNGANAGTGTSFASYGSGASVVVYGKDVYYVSENRVPCVMRGLGQPEPLVRGSINDYITAAGETYLGIGNAAQEHYEPYIGMADELHGYVAWLVPSSPVSFVFYYHLDTSAVSVQVLDGIYTAGAVSGYNPYLEVLYDDYDNDVTPIVRKLDPTGSVQPSWTMTTGFVSLQPVEPKELGIGAASTAVIKVRPVFSDDTATQPKITITSSSTLQMADPRTTTMDPADGFVVNSQGWYGIPEGKLVGEMFKFSVEMPAGGSVGSILGLQIDAVEAGIR